MSARPAHERYASLSWLIVAMTVVALAIGAIAARYVESRLVASRGESLALAAAEIAHKLDILLAERYSDVRALAKNPLLRGRDAAAKNAYLDSLRTISPLYLLLGVTDAQGRFVAATDRACIGMDMSRSPWFQAVRSTKQVYAGDVEPFAEAGGVDAISFTAPIEGADGKFQGAVTTRVGLPLLEEVVARTLRTFRAREESWENLEYKFVTSIGAVFIDSDLFHKGNGNLKQRGLPSVLLSESGHPGYVEEEQLQRHVRVLTGYARTGGVGEFPGLQWTVLLSSDRDDLVAPVRSMLRKLAGAWVLVWLPMFVFALWSSARLRKEWERAQIEHAHALTAEANYRQLVEQARDIIYRTDAQGRFTFVNPVVIRHMGYSPQELLGRRFIELIRPDVREDAERFYGRQFARKTPSTYYEFPAVTSDGTEIWIGQNVQTLIENDHVIGFHAVARDITKRKRTEEALRGTTEYLRALIQASPLAIINLNSDSNVMSWNRAAEDMLGWSESEVLGKPLPYIPAGKEAEADALWDEAMQGSGLNGIEIRRMKKDGTPIDLEVWSRTFRDARGAHVSSLGILSDITARKELEQTLQASETRFRTLTSFAPVGIFFTDPRGNCLLVNERWTELAGLSPEEAKGQGWVQALHPEDRERVSQEWYDAALAGREFQSEYRFQTRAGTVNWLVGRAMALRDGEGTVTGYIGSVTDITERKRAEEALAASEKRLRTILEAEPECVKVTTGDGILLDMNAAGLAMIEADSLDQVIGRSVCPLIAPAHRNAFAEFTRRVYRGEPGTMQFELIGLKGTHRWVDTRAVPLRDESNDTIGVLAITRDITERKQTEEARERLVAELAESRNRFEMFFRQTPSAISITTVKDGRFLDVNKQAEILTGYSREELIGRTTVEMNLYVEPADRPRLVQKLKETGVLTDLERQIRTKSGEIRTAIFSLVPTLMGSEPCLLSIAHDITERKRAEEGLRERSRQQAIEAELSRVAVTSQDLSDLLGTAVTLVSNALAVDYCEVLELLSNGTDARLCASAGWRGDQIGQVKTMRTGSLPHAALHSDQPVIIQDIRTGGQTSGPPWMHRHGTVGGMGVTIRGKEAPWGILAVYAAGARAFSRDDVNFLQTVTSILATAIERMQTENVLRSANRALRLLSSQLLQVQEDDRRAIARDLHDEIGQSLTAIKLNVERAQRTTDRDARSRIMQDCAQITERVLDQVRDLSLNLHPSILDDLGLAYALKWYADRQAERAGLKVDVAADASLPRLPQEVEIACFRIAQEALTNVVRHARAGQASITLKRGASVVELCIQDDGIGFVADTISSPANGGTSIGLTSMQERAKLLGGSVKITSAPRCGTKVIATLPVLAVSPASMPKEEAPRS